MHYACAAPRSAYQLPCLGNDGVSCSAIPWAIADCVVTVTGDGDEVDSGCGPPSGARGPSQGPSLGACHGNAIIIDSPIKFSS